MFKKNNSKKEVNEVKETSIETDLNNHSSIEHLLGEFLSKEKEDYSPPIESNKLKMIQEDIIRQYTSEVLQALVDEEVRDKLVESVLKSNGHMFKYEREIAEYIVRESVGTGIIEKILLNEAITDIGWNGTLLSIETNSENVLIDGKRLGITEEYIERVIQKYAVVNDRDFNSTNTVLDGMFKNIRISATHKDNSPIGSTMSIRVARPRLALNESNFKEFAPTYILELFEKIVKTKANIVISGETGTGKTELQKLLLGFVPPHERIIMIEDVQETHLQKLYPYKDIFSWLTSPKKTISDLVKASLRNNPRWIIVSECRGAEAYEMLQSVLSGHHIITTLHAVDAQAIPRRFVNMCSSGYKINETSVQEDIERYFDFGVHIKKVVIDGKVIRYLNEIVEFNEQGSVTLFKQKYINGEFVCEHGELSLDFQERMAEKFLSFKFPDEVREVGVKVNES